MLRKKSCYWSYGSKGEAVGVIAAQSIGETQNTALLYEHSTSVVSLKRTNESELKAKYSGKLEFEEVKLYP